MNKSFTFASLIVILVLTLAHFSYIPSYIGVTISICVFVIAVSSSIGSVIRSSITEIKDVEKKNNVLVQKAFENINEKLGSLLTQIEDDKESFESQMEIIHTDVEQIHSAISNFSQNILREGKTLSSKFDEQLKIIGKNSDCLSDAVKRNSSEIEKLNGILALLSEEIRHDIEKINNVTDNSYKNVCIIIDNITNNLSQKIESVVSNLNSLNDSIELYTTSSNSLKESHMKFSNDISVAIKSIMELMSSISRDNHHLIDDLKDVTSNSIDSILKGVKESLYGQTESLSDSEDKIRQSVNKLCNSLSSNLQKLEIDIDSIRESVEDMQKMSQFVEKSDKDLLARISKLCK